VVLAALVLFSFTGCYAVEESPERTVIRFAPVWRFVMIAFPLGLIGVGFVLCYFQLTRIPGAIVVLAVAGLSVLIVPQMYLDAVVITPTGIDQPTGFWFERKPRGFRYAEVRSISIRTVPEGKSTMRVWALRRKDGTTQEIAPGDLWNFNETLIVTKLRGYGVTFE
jgi:hypothetical protein